MKLFDEIDKSQNEVAIKYINSFAGSLPEHISGCKGEASKAVKIFSTNACVMNSIHRPRNGEYCIDVTSVEKHNVFFKISDAQLELYSPIIRLSIVLLLNYFSTRHISSNNILFCLDELASFGKIDLIGSLRKLRKNRIRIFCLTQSLTDMEMIYWETETKAMMNNFAFKVVLGATDTETQEYFSKLIGHRKVRQKSVRHGIGRNYSVTETDSKEYAVEPEDLARLKNSLILIYPGGYIKLKKNYYYKRFRIYEIHIIVFSKEECVK